MQENIALQHISQPPIINHSLVDSLDHHRLGHCFNLLYFTCIKSTVYSLSTGRNLHLRPNISLWFSMLFAIFPSNSFTSLRIRGSKEYAIRELKVCFSWHFFFLSSRRWLSDFFFSSFQRLTWRKSCLCCRSYPKPTRLSLAPTRSEVTAQRSFQALYIPKCDLSARRMDFSAFPPAVRFELQPEVVFSSDRLLLLQSAGLSGSS